MPRRKVLFAALLLAALCALGMPANLHASVAVSISVFHDQLTPYGRWVVAGSYGNVWVPHVAVGWAPYVDGQWVYTDYGWTWVSSDPWGGVPCHYGSWAWVDPYGWVWTPGTVWAPAWVTWAYSGDYVGWAPIPPSFALSVTGYVGAPVVVATTRYCFVPARQFVGVNVASVRVPVARNATIFSSAVKTTNFRVSEGIVRTAGPPTAQIEKAAARRIAPVSIDRVKTAPTTLEQAGVTRASRVAVAAPAVERQRLTAEKAAPKAESSRAAAHPEKSTEAARSPKPSSQSERVAESKPKAASKPKPKPESETAPKQGENRSTAHKPAPSHPATPPQNAHQKKKPEPEARPEPSGTSAKSAPPREAPPQKRPDKATDPTEETRVASHAGQQPAQTHAQPAPPRPKPAEKKAPPPKEKEPPAGDQKPGD